MPLPEPPLPSPDFGPRLRALREARGLTQAGLAAALGVGRSAVAQWESGRANVASPHLRRLADTLGVAVDHLMQPDRYQLEAVEQSAEERALLRLFRACGATDRQLLLLLARRLASPEVNNP